MPHRTVFSEEGDCKTQMYLARRGELTPAVGNPRPERART